MADYGIKIAQAGYDVGTATDLELSLSSKFNSLKNYLIGTLSVTFPSNTANGSILSVTFSHNLGFTPAISFFPYDGTVAASSSFIRQFTGALSPTTRTYLLDSFFFSFDIDSTSLKLYAWAEDSNVFPNTNAITIYFKYYIFTQQLG